MSQRRICFRPAKSDVSPVLLQRRSSFLRGPFVDPPLLLGAGRGSAASCRKVRAPRVEDVFGTARRNTKDKGDDATAKVEKEKHYRAGGGQYFFRSLVSDLELGVCIG